ncbi:MAG: hypothetical protein LBC77_04255 [Spirochaetaceae bacterium]|jgi:hypothetical protein|nr:hypothetical protein [Spirochaetaceae bacterium]
MKTSKKPSIFDDRSGIGSSDELDEYGVWVKSAPEDLLAQDSEAEEFGIMADFTEQANDSQSFDFDFSSGVPELSDSRDENEQAGINAESLDFDGFVSEDANCFEDFNESPAEGAFSESSTEDPQAEEAGFPQTEEPPLDETALAAGGDDFNVDFELEEPVESDAEKKEDDFNVDFDVDIAPAPAVSSGRTDAEDAPKDGQSTVTTELLLKIANEISALKTDLDNLKKELSTIRDDARVEPSALAPDAEENSADESIDTDVALTGDELNGVLDNADLTHETAEVTDEDFSSGIEAEIEDESGLEIGIEGEIDAGTEDFDMSSLDALNAGADTGMETDGSGEIQLDIGGNDDDAESISLTGDELGKLDDEDESISLTGDELDKLDEEDESISLTEDELSILNNDGGDSDGMDIDEAVKEESANTDETLTNDELNNIINTADLTEETGMSAETAESDAPLDFDIDLELSENTAAKTNDESPFDFSGETGEAESTEFEVDDPSPADEEPEEPTPPLPPPEEEKTSVPPQEGMAEKFKNEIRTVLAYMDQLLESLPEEKIEEFARSDKFDIYKKVFKELDLV